MSSGWAGGSTRKWRKLRKEILDRDRHRCRLRLSGCTTIATCVHHLDGKALGDRPDRLVASCQPCNLKIGDPAKPRRIQLKQPADSAKPAWRTPPEDPEPVIRTNW